MSKPRKVRGVPITFGNAEQVREQERLIERARTAPVIDTPIISTPRQTGNIINTAKVGTNPKRDVFWLIATDETLYRIPEQLWDWAYDLIVMVLVHGGNNEIHVFPCKIEFGILRGQYYAQMLE